MRVRIPPSASSLPRPCGRLRPPPRAAGRAQAEGPCARHCPVGLRTPSDASGKPRACSRGRSWTRSGAGSRPSCLRSSVEEQRASTPRAEVRILSEVLASLAGEPSRPAKPGSGLAGQETERFPRHRGRAVGARLQSAMTAVRFRPVSLAKRDNEKGGSTMNVKTFGPVDERSLKQLERCMEAGDAEFGVLCADHHPGYSQPIGGGIAYEAYVSPSGVGYDIGCGNKAAETELTRADLAALGGVEAVMHEITRRISFGMGVAAQERVDHPVLDKIRNADFAPQRKLAQVAESQLGTVGSGNHYVNLMEDENGHIWVGVHFGSRGFGHKTAS